MLWRKKGYLKIVQRDISAKKGYIKIVQKGDPLGRQGRGESNLREGVGEEASAHPGAPPPPPPPKSAGVK